jgi:hypothetical protein
MRKFLLLGALIAAQASPAAAAIKYHQFKNLTNLTVVGNAAGTKTGDGHVLRLVPQLNYQSGAFYATAPVTLGKNGAFSTQFQFRVTGPAGALWADGLTFFLAQSPTGVGTGDNTGQYLGYSGVPNSIAVEFDTYYNGGFDAAPNEVAVDTDGSVETINNPAGSWGQPYGQGDACNNNGPTQAGCMSDGEIWTATITYDGTLINVTVQDGSNAPFQVITNYPLNVLSTIGTQSVYAGFTGATGGLFADFDVLNWDFYSKKSLP